MSNNRVFLYIGFLFLIFFFLKGLWFIFPRVFQTLELQSQDALTRLIYSIRDDQSVSPDIIYVDLDDKSLLRLPYSKNDPKLYSSLISILRQAEVAMQLIDIVFVSADETADLVEASKSAGNVYLPLVFTNQTVSEAPAGDSPFALPESAKWIQGAAPDPLSFPRGDLVISNLPQLNLTAAGLGHINCWPDHDGVYRRIPLFFISHTHLIPALSLRVASDYLMVPPEKITIGNRNIVLNDAAFPDGRVEDITIPFNEDGQSRVRFVGPWPYNFAHYSVATLLEKAGSTQGLQELQDELEGAIVIISDVTTGGRDFGPLPFSSYSPLSGLHAQFLHSILINTFLYEATPAWILMQEMLLLLLLATMAYTMRGFLLIGGAAVTVSLFFLTNLGLLAFFHILYPLVRPMVFIALGTISILLVQYISIQQEKRVMKARLTPYFAPSVMEKILASPEILSNVSKKELTILFSDIVGFSAWSSTKEAHEIHETLNRYFHEMSTIVFAFEGTIDKFMGDGMLAFFGDPTPHVDHAERAVRAAIAMQQKAWELKKEWAQSGGMRLRIRIGLHTGEVVVGNMGSLERMDYTVIGSHVNLAQRLENSCSPDRILISREVLGKLDDRFVTTTGGEIEAKGFTQPISVFYVDRYQPSASEDV